MIPRVIAAAAFLAAALSAPCAAQTNQPVPVLTPATRAAIDADVARAIHTFDVTAATVAVVEDGRVVYVRGFGLRNVARSLPARAGTHYEIGSITKQFTAAAIVQFQEAGKIDLDATVATYLPSLPHAREITVRQLLTHTSGLHEYLDGFDVVPLAGKPATFAQIMARGAARPLDFRPGTKWAYSNTNYLVLGKIVEAVAHEPYETYVREHLFGPAGMTQTTTMAHEASVSDMARGYTLRNGKPIPAPALDNSWAWSAGNIVSTAGDMAKWGDALTSGKIVTQQGYALMTTAQRLADGASTHYGFGLVIDRFDGQPRIWHNGGTFGYNADDQFFPKQNVRIIALTNDADAPSEALVQTVYGDLFPAIAARAQRPAQGEDPAVTARIQAFILALLNGKLDRSQVTPQANAAVSDATVQQVSAQLAPLGTPRFVYRGVTKRSAGSIYVYRLVFPKGTFKLTIGIDDATNKFSTFWIGPQ